MMKRLLIAFLGMVLLWTTGSTAMSGLAFSEPGAKSDVSLQQLATKERTVYFNTQSLKYHRGDCEWAHRCTRNCVWLPLSEARRRGGIPCKVCGG